jgi:UDP-N-acetyl-D-glucosamine/UDP-N-acetyl-D-galactosamine dehydrogenase
MAGGETIAVIGLGYVGLPVALAFAHYFPTIGFDINPDRVAALKRGEDRTGEADPAALQASRLEITCDPAALARATVFVICVPTPVDEAKQPDLRLLEHAAHTVGRAVWPGGLVIVESTVFPGATEDIVGPIVAAQSGLTQSSGFQMGFSPERINPGDHVHRLENVVKVVAGDTPETVERMAALYGAIVPVGVFRAASIKAAEAAKILENVQRDLNVALMNELALICDRMGLRTRDVLAAAQTKWNFMPFTPGLVGGHCIGVDPYYLTARAEALGYRPEVILAGRRINDTMGKFIAEKAVKMLCARGSDPGRARVGVMGMTFKENIPDVRNSRAPSIVKELREYGVSAIAADPHADPHDVAREYGFSLAGLEDVRELDLLILAVPHRVFLDDFEHAVLGRLQPGGILMDVKSAAVNPELIVSKGFGYWSL